jgi:hypothetical protein
MIVRFAVPKKCGEIIATQETDCKLVLAVLVFAAEASSGGE